MATELEHSTIYPNGPKLLRCVVSTYLYGPFDCMFLSCYVHISEKIHTQPFSQTGCLFMNWVVAGFQSSSSHLNFRFCTCLEQGVSWHSDNYRVWTHSETGTWHDKNIQSLSWLFLSLKALIIPIITIISIFVLISNICLFSIFILAIVIKLALLCLHHWLTWKLCPLHFC